jgi:hypothetical protein
MSAAVPMAVLGVVGGGIIGASGGKERAAEKEEEARDRAKDDEKFHSGIFLRFEEEKGSQPRR